MTDRRVHAEIPEHLAVVRYDKAGKWYIESPGKRRPVQLRDAITEASYIAYAGGNVYLGLPGGQAFDRGYRRLNPT